MPLLEDALRELYERRGPDGLLTFAAYEELGGVVGALGKRAEQVFQSLPPEAQAAFPALLARLVTVDPGEHDTAVRQRAVLPPAGTGAAPDPAAGLVAALVGQRLLTADRVGDDATITLAHEAMLRCWPRLREWFAGEREFLRVRARVGEAAAAWTEHQRHDDYLLAEGRPLAEARDRLEHRLGELEPADAEFLRRSVENDRRKRAALQKRRRFVLIGTTSLAGVALFAALMAIAARDRAIAARNASESLANYILFDLRDRLTQLGQQRLLDEANRRYQAYQKAFGTEGGAGAERNRMVSLTTEGDILLARGAKANMGAARFRYEEAMSLARKLAASDPANLHAQRDVSFMSLASHRI